MSLLTRRDVIERWCKLNEQVAEHFAFQHPADCFCGTGGFWGVSDYDPGADYRYDSAVLEFVETSVRAAMAT